MLVAALSALFLLLLDSKAAEGAINPCEHRDGSGRTEVDLEFTESRGASDHLPTLGESRSLSVHIHGQVRAVNDTATATAQTIVLRPWELDNENKFENGSFFRPLELYFQVDFKSGKVLVSLKQGIDREILGNIYTPGIKGVTNGTAKIKFHVECTPDDQSIYSYARKNFTVNVIIKDVNDNHPVFYNATSNTVTGNLTATVRQGTPKNTLIFHGVVTRDKDEGENARTRVRLVRNFFFEAAVNTSEIQIYTRRQISYEYFGGQQHVTVVIIASDSPAIATEVLTTQTTITVTLLEEEDPPPVFVIPGCLAHLSRCVSPTYSTRVASNHTGPLLIGPGPIQAVVPDSLEFFSIRYSLLESESSNNFSIDERTGQVTQQWPVEQSVMLAVKAMKCTGPSDYSTCGRYSYALLMVSVEAQDANCTREEDTKTKGAMPLTLLLSSITGGIVVILLAALTIYLRQRRQQAIMRPHTGEAPHVDRDVQPSDSGGRNSDASEQTNNAVVPEANSNNEASYTKLSPNIHELDFPRNPWKDCQNTIEPEEDDSA